MSSQRKSSRRQFIGRTAAALPLVTIVPRWILGGPGYTPPSEQLTKAVIGCGGMGMGHVKSINPTAKLLAVCDVDESHMNRAMKAGGKDVKGYRDFREVLERRDIDVIHVPTPPHWHALISIAAANAGKDIWCEKPMSRTIGEGRKVVEAVQANGRIFRLNTWFRFQSNLYGFGTTAKPVRKLVESGLLGWPLKATVGAATGFNWKFGWSGKTDLKPQEVPKNLDYDFWLGPAPFKPYHRHRTHGTFRGYWDYDGGGLGDMGQHYLDPVQYIIGKDDTSPVSIEADTSQQHHDAVSAWRYIVLKYVDGCEIHLDGENRYRNAPFLEGPNGKVWKGMKSDIKDLDKKLAEFPDPAPQQTDFVDSVKNRKTFALNEANAHRSCCIINLAKVALRVRRPLEYDPVKEVFVGDEEANRYLNPPMRGPWHL